MCANIHGGGWTAKGFPDLICCINGRFVAFELKVGINRMQTDQRIWRDRIISAGGLHYTPYTLQEFAQIVERILKNDIHAGCDLVGEQTEQGDEQL